MKIKPIRFFSPQDNTLAKPKKETAKAKKTKPLKLEGYISPSGKLVIPAKTFDQLDFPADTTFLQIGADAGKRKIKTLYLVPTDSQDGAFELVKAAKSYTISLGHILKSGGIDFAETKYSFTLAPYTEEAGTTGYALKLTSDQAKPAKPAYTGKPRGRRPKASS